MCNGIVEKNVDISTQNLHYTSENLNCENICQNDENTSKLTAAAALMNDIGGHDGEKSSTNKVQLTDAQKQTVEKILEKLFSPSKSILKKESTSTSQTTTLPIVKDSSIVAGAGNNRIEKGLTLMSLLNQNVNVSKIMESLKNQKSINAKSSSLKETIAENNIQEDKSEEKDENEDGDDDDDDDDEEYVEYVFKPRRYFLFSMCHFCKRKLKELALPCKVCFMTYYCSIQHMVEDKQHKNLCATLRSLADSAGGHIFNGTNTLSGEHFRNYRVQMLKKCEDNLGRKLELFEKEIILYPKICCRTTCREWRYTHVSHCKDCGQVAFCKKNPEHLDDEHKLWCTSFSVMAQLIRLQEIYGNIEPDMPTEILRSNLNCEMSMKNILDVLYKNNKIKDDLSFANATQVATAPLTAWYCLKMFETINKTSLNVHIVGAEFHFEVNILQKWEYFFLHLVPTLNELNVIFIGPELTIPGLSFDLLSKQRMCKKCRNEGRKVNFKFEDSLYHDYYKSSNFIKPDLVCFFNPGLHRFTGFENIDTWAETIHATAEQKCPIIVTSYTEYESPLDLKRFVLEAQRSINIILPPVKNPFSSTKPERNFISDEFAPLMFKNFYCFVVE